LKFGTEKKFEARTSRASYAYIEKLSLDNTMDEPDDITCMGIINKTWVFFPFCAAA